MVFETTETHEAGCHCYEGPMMPLGVQLMGDHPAKILSWKVAGLDNLCALSAGPHLHGFQA